MNCFKKEEIKASKQLKTKQYDKQVTSIFNIITKENPGSSLDH